jgi:hypothetical protein
MMRTLIVLSFCIASAVHAQTVSITPDGPDLKIDIDGQLFTRYATTGSKRPHMYPVMGANGAALTRTYPIENKEDHPHHSSIWFAHGSVNGTDFWLDDPKAGTIKHTGFADVKAEGSSGSFTAHSQWVKPDGSEALTDERHITITALADGARQIDFTITLIAGAQDVTFEDTKEGSMAIRVAPCLSIKEGTGKIITSAGIKDKKVWGTKAEWVAYYGPDPKGEPATITMMDHPLNLRHPSTWHARDYGLFACNPFGLHDFEKSSDKTKGNHTIAKGSSMTQRYRILIQKGNPDKAKIGEVFTAFSATK